MKLDKEDIELINEASQIAKENADMQELMNFVLASCVKAKSGKIYKGVNITTSHSICAEQVALGQALACGEREFDTIVTVKLDNTTGKTRVVSPCGLCRYTFDKLKLNDMNVIVEDIQNDTVLKVKMGELLPYPYARHRKNKENKA